MSIDKTRLEYLWQQYFNKKCTAEERRELMIAILVAENKELITGKIETEFEAIDHGEQAVEIGFPEEQAGSMFETIVGGKEKATIIPLQRRGKKIFRWIAAASIIVVLGIGYLVYFNKSKVEAPQTTIAKGNDVPAPKETRAVITLADGSKVYLDSVNNGTIAQESNVNVVKTADGKIIYNANGQQLTANSPVYNTLSNPRGSKVIDMTLSDGSHVWLNAGSSITYPVAFMDKERKVTMTGEAYFEVAHNASKPFIVTKGETSVTVLGTHFNVNAYDDEDALRVTLLEGSVQVSAGLPGLSSSAVKIKPGQQAIAASGKLQVASSVDLDAVMAWKNGQFNLQSTDLAMLMRQVARWYDVDVEYKGAIPKNKFGGSLNRNLNLSTLLKALQQSGVNAQLEGRKIVVSE